MIYLDGMQARSPRGEEQRIPPMGPDRRHRRWKKQLGIAAFGGPVFQQGPAPAVTLDMVKGISTEQS